MVETKEVEFDDGTVVEVNNEGEVEGVESPNPIEQFFDRLEEQYEVDRRADDTAFFGRDHIDMDDFNVEELADEVGVNIRNLWTTYEQDNTELHFFVALY